MVQPTNMGAVQSKAWSEFLGHVEAFAPRFQAILTEASCPVQTVVTNQDLSGGVGGPGQDQQFLSFTHEGLTSKYHLYAAGLDWTKPVGILIYCDGTGEYGLNNPNTSYLMAGENGLAAVAKRHNLILLTPMAPGGKCDSASGVCWYQHSGSVSMAQKTAWSVALIEHVYTRYNVDKTRVCFGGYSSGAEWAAHFFGPKAASSLVSDGVGVCISYGGYYGGTPTISDTFKRNVVMTWDVGDSGTTETAALAAARRGEAWYRGQGFKTSLTVVPGQTHSRSGQFGAVVDREITKHLRPA